MANICDTFIIGYDESETDVSVLSVAVYSDGGYQQVNVIRGPEAKDMYNKLISKAEATNE